MDKLYAKCDAKKNQKENHKRDHEINETTLTPSEKIKTTEENKAITARVAQIKKIQEKNKININIKKSNFHPIQEIEFTQPLYDLEAQNNERPKNSALKETLPKPSGFKTLSKYLETEKVIKTTKDRSALTKNHKLR